MKFGSSIVIPKDSAKKPLYDAFSSEEDPGVFLVRDFSTFIQLIGKLKYNAAQHCGQSRRIYFRGQVELYGGRLIPSAYRYSGKSSKIGAVNDRIDALIEKLKMSLNDLAMLPAPIVEGVFQQYGLKSRWIDAVDNIWVALWFACHRCWVTSNGDIHYERRDFRCEKNSKPYAYVLVLEADLANGNVVGNGGYCRGKKCECVDLRCALPSYYIRPHVQHGVLVRPLSGHGKVVRDAAGMVRSIVKIELADALRWLGDGSSFSVGSLFPPPHFDTGLQKLLMEESSVFAGEKNYDNSPVRFSRIWA